MNDEEVAQYIKFVENTQFISGRGRIQTLISLIEAEQLSTTLKVEKKKSVHSVVSASLDCSLPGSSVMEFSRQEYCSRQPFPPPGDLLYPGIEPRSLALQWIFCYLIHQGSPFTTLLLLISCKHSLHSTSNCA